MSSAAPALSRVLCATDLSEFGNRAVPYAFAITAPGGHVSLLHVLRTPGVPSPLLPRYGAKRAGPQELDTQEREASARLTELAWPGADARSLPFDVMVVRAARVSEAILAEAERIDAEAICLVTHSRSGLAELILGSAAQELLQRSRRPMLLIPSPLAD